MTLTELSPLICVLIQNYISRFHGVQKHRGERAAGCRPVSGTLSPAPLSVGARRGAGAGGGRVEPGPTPGRHDRLNTIRRTRPLGAGQSRLRAHGTRVRHWVAARTRPCSIDSTYTIGHTRGHVASPQVLFDRGRRVATAVPRTTNYIPLTTYRLWQGPHRGPQGAATGRGGYGLGPRGQESKRGATTGSGRGRVVLVRGGLMGVFILGGLRWPLLSRPGIGRLVGRGMVEEWRRVCLSAWSVSRTGAGLVPVRGRVLGSDPEQGNPSGASWGGVLCSFGAPVCVPGSRLPPAAPGVF